MEWAGPNPMQGKKKTQQVFFFSLQEQAGKGLVNIGQARPYIFYNTRNLVSSSDGSAGLPKQALRRIKNSNDSTKGLEKLGI